ncbi:MAG: DUF3185 domain-containing protein [bacterium]
MRPVVLVGVILIALGVIALAYEGITYTTKRTVVDVGPVEVQAEEQRRIPLPPLLGAVAIGGGLVLVLAGSKRGASA